MYDFFIYGIIYPAIFGLIGGAIGSAARLGMSKFTVMIPLIVITVVTGGLPPQVFAQKPVLSTPPPRGYQLMETESESRRGWQFHGWRLERDAGRITTKFRLYSGNPYADQFLEKLDGSCVVVLRMYYAVILPPAREMGNIRNNWQQGFMEAIKPIPLPLWYGGFDASFFSYDPVSRSYATDITRSGYYLQVSLRDDHLVYAYTSLETKEYIVDYSGQLGTVPDFDQLPFRKTLVDDLNYYIAAEPWRPKSQRRDAGTPDIPPGYTAGRGTLTARDAMNALKMSVGTLPVDPAADIDRDGQVTARDATIILRLVVGR